MICAVMADFLCTVGGGRGTGEGVLLYRVIGMEILGVSREKGINWV